MTSGHNLPDGDKPMDPLWKNPTSLNTPQAAFRRGVFLGIVVGILSCTYGKNIIDITKNTGERVLVLLRENIGPADTLIPWR